MYNNTDSLNDRFLMWQQYLKWQKGEENEQRYDEMAGGSLLWRSFGKRVCQKGDGKAGRAGGAHD
jgi:hypothetical protein